MSSLDSTTLAALRALAERYAAIDDNPINWTTEAFEIADEYGRAARGSVLALLDECERLRGVEEQMKLEVSEACEAAFACGQICHEDHGIMVANEPRDAVQRLSNRYAESKAEADRLRALVLEACEIAAAQCSFHPDEADRIDAIRAEVTRG